MIKLKRHNVQLADGRTGYISGSYDVDSIQLAVTIGDKLEFINRDEIQGLKEVKQVENVSTDFRPANAMAH